MDEMIVSDAGFPIPDNVRTVDLSIAKNEPGVLRILEEIAKYCSVEKIVVANEMCTASPTMVQKVKNIFGPKVAFESIPHVDLKARSKSVKGVVRSGEFTAFSNILLVSGSGDRWYAERG